MHRASYPLPARGVGKVPPERFKVRYTSPRPHLQQRDVIRSVKELKSQLHQDSRRASREFHVNMWVAGFSIGLAVFSIVLSCLFKVQNDRALDRNNIVLSRVDTMTTRTGFTTDKILEYVSNRRPDEGRVAMAPAPTASQTQFKDLFAAALRASRSGRNKEAIRLLDSLVALYPGSASVYSNRGLARSATGDTAGALNDLAEAIRLDSGIAAAYINRGNIRSRRGQMSEALSDLNKAVEYSSDKGESTAALVNRGVALRGLRRIPEAVADYEAAARLSPREASIYFNLANAYIDLGDLVVADSFASKAIEQDRNYAAAYNLRGTIRYDRYDARRALADHTEAVRLDTTAASYRYRRAMDFRILGMRDSAIADLQHAVELDPSSADALSSLGLSLAESANEMTARGQTSEARARWLEAIDHYNAALNLRARMPAERTALVEHWRVLARRRYGELYGTPADR